MTSCFNNASRDKDNILGQIYKKKDNKFGIYYDFTKKHANIGLAL